MKREDQEKVILEYIDEPPATMIDCGVGPGREAWVIKEAYPDCQVFGFEPHPERYKKLRSIFPGILFQMALWSRTMQSYLYSKPGNEFAKPAPSLYYGDCRAKFKQRDLVSCVTLFDADNFLNFKEPILLWADIEGAELEMLQGTGDTLDKCRWVNLEVRDEPRTDDACTHHQVNNLLVACGFQMIHEYGYSDDVFHDVIYRKVD